MSEIVYQSGFAEMGVRMRVAGNVVNRCRVMLIEEPKTREDYKYAYVRYLMREHGLAELLAGAPSEAEFEAWYMAEEVPDYRTVANRIQDLFRSEADLRPPAKVTALRKRQRTQGRVVQ